MPSSLTDPASRVQDKASDAMRAGRTAAADGLDGAANRLHTGGDRVADAAHSAADKLGASASYMRNKDGAAILRDIGNIVKEHPGKVLLGAVVVGFLAGRAFSRD
jgi:hypothetical protein